MTEVMDDKEQPTLKILSNVNGIFNYFEFFDGFITVYTEVESWSNTLPSLIFFTSTKALPPNKFCPAVISFLCV